MVTVVHSTLTFSVMNKQEHALETLRISEALSPVASAHWENIAAAGVMTGSWRLYNVGATSVFGTVVVMVVVPEAMVVYA